MENSHKFVCHYTALVVGDTIRCGALHFHNLICLFPLKKTQVQEGKVGL